MQVAQSAINDKLHAAQPEEHGCRRRRRRTSPRNTRPSQEHSCRGVRHGASYRQQSAGPAALTKVQGNGKPLVRILRSSMKRASLHRLTLWLLPLLVARAFVPVGFMLSTDASGLSLVFCTGISITEPAPSHAAHHGHAEHHDQHDQGDEHQADGAALCPFAVASMSVNLEIPTLAAEPLPELYVSTLDSTLPPETRLLRSQSIRGPPALS